VFHVGVGEWEDDENYFVFHKVPLSETITKKPKSESEPTPEPESLETKKITIHEDTNDGIYTPVPMGLILLDDGWWRMYTFDRRNKKMIYFESKNLEEWGGPKAADNQEKGTYFQFSDGDVIFYRERKDDEDGDQIKIFDVSNDFKELTFKGSYDWRLDGALNMSEIDGVLYATGRVRGNRPKDEGGWDNDMPDYPNVDDIPRIEEAFDEYAPDWMSKDVIDKVLKDRRGISLHISTDKGKTWSEGDIIADPKWYDTPETKGWNVEKENGVGDFYSSVLLDEKKMLVKLYKKEKDRVIERGAGDPNYKFHRRFRFTGETILVPGIFKDGKVQLLDNKSIIPPEFHERKTPGEVPNATCKDCVEVGQTSPFSVIEKDGFMYLFYGYRDDIHYEGDWNFTAGIYIAKMPMKDFIKKF